MNYGCDEEELNDGNDDDALVGVGDTDPPTQEDINDGLCLSDDYLKAYRAGKVYYEHDNEDEGGDPPFWAGLAAEIERQKDWHFRIFFVSDHGNVTEYNSQGEVLGEWV